MDDGTIKKVLTYVDEHIHEKISLSELAQIAGYSPFYFSRLFTEAMGMPATAYVRIRKLQYAAVSLQEGNKVLDVALLYGFDSHEGFTRAFTKLFGLPPSVVRKRSAFYTVPEVVVPETTNGRDIMTAANKNDRQHNMHRLVFEVLKESLEEAKAGYCHKIEVTLFAEGSVRIRDDGRGIPLSEDLHAGKEIMDKILAGKPITNEEYGKLGDLSNAGLQTVNSLCEAMAVTVIRNGRRFRQDYVRGIARHELLSESCSCQQGMEIVLKPDRDIFADEVFSEERIKNWLKENAKEIQNLTFHCCMSHG